MKLSALLSLLAGAVLASAALTAQAADQCSAPTALSGDSYDVAPGDERNACLQKTVTTPADYYMLVFSWSPGFCQSKKQANGQYPKSLEFQCSATSNFGWVVHGLWGELRNPATCAADPGKPEKLTPLHPRYCQSDLPALPASVILANMCTMPGERLIQGEWEKHGACAFQNAPEYFAKIRELRGQLTLPPETMAQSALFNWMRSNNPILANKQLDYDPGAKELHVCYATDWTPMDCPAAPTKAAGGSAPR